MTGRINGPKYSTPLFKRRPRCLWNRKICHKTEDSAQRHIDFLVGRRQEGETGLGELHAYECPHCDWWHVGHAMKF